VRGRATKGQVFGCVRMGTELTLGWFDGGCGLSIGRIDSAIRFKAGKLFEFILWVVLQFIMLCSHLCMHPMSFFQFIFQI
jgi:hypothetical protein